jgi:hypothetical protein
MPELAEHRDGTSNVSLQCAFVSMQENEHHHPIAMAWTELDAQLLPRQRTHSLSAVELRSWWGIGLGCLHDALSVLACLATLQSRFLVWVLERSQPESLTDPEPIWGSSLVQVGRLPNCPAANPPSVAAVLSCLRIIEWLLSPV